VVNAAVLIASLAFAALVIAAIPVVLQLRRTARAAETTLATFEREVRPLASRLDALLQDHRDLSQQATRDLKAVEELTTTAGEMLARVSRVTGIIGTLGTVGRAFAVARGLRRGARVFIERVSRRRT